MPGGELLSTPIHEWHLAHQARMVEFAGWSMPVQYSTIVEEHRAVRTTVGLFDISHMGRLFFSGRDALAWLNQVTTNDVARLEPGQIQYSLMTNERGGVIDDVLVYQLYGYWMVVCNASNRGRVVAQFEHHRAGLDAKFEDVTTMSNPLGGKAMIALQGPAALPTLLRLLPVEASAIAEMPYYQATVGHLKRPDGSHLCEPWISRTGYTGEDGFEIITWGTKVLEVWEALLEAGREFGIRPCGLGARDTLRFEAAMPLYGHELSDTINPYEAGLGKFVKLAKGDFVGREALSALKASPKRKRIGLALDGRRIARQGSAVLHDGHPVGEVTSGTFSPSLDRSLAMALVSSEIAQPDRALTVEIRGQAEPAHVVPLPFYRHTPRPSVV